MAAEPIEAFAKGKINRVRTTLFLEQQQQVWGLVMPTTAVEALMAAKGQWKNVSDELATVTGSSRIGKLLFSHAVQQSIMEQMQLKQSSAMEKLWATPTVGPRDIAKVQKDLVRELCQMPNAELVPSKREVKVSYRGCDLKYMVGSLHEEVDLRLQSSIKSRATSLGELLPLACEDDLVPAKKEGIAGQIQPALIAAAAHSRKMVNSEMESMGLKLGSEIQETLHLV